MGEILRGRFQKRQTFFVFVFLLLLTFKVSFASQIDSLLTPQEKTWLEEHGSNIRYAPNPSWPPADFINEKGLHQGIVSDYITIFEDRLGITFKEVQYNSWSEIINGLKTGEVDFVGAIQKTKDRQKFLSYTEAYMQTPVVLLVRNDYPGRLTSREIQDMKLAGVTNYTSVNYIQQNYPGANIVKYETDLRALMQTSLGNTDGTIVDLMTASYLVEKYGINNLSLGKTLNYRWDIRFASVKSKPLLHSILRKVLATVDGEKRKEIYNRWVNVGNIEASSVFERNYQRLLYVTIAIVVIIVGISLYSYQLKRQVKQKTSTLQEEIAQKKRTEEKLRTALDERETLLAEIHHRVKNNLAVISSLLQLESMHIEEEEAQSTFSNSVMRIKSMALVHEQLYATSDFKNIPLHHYLDELIETIRDKFDPEKTIHTEKELDQVYLNLNSAVAVALLLNELLVNTFKHAFPEYSEGNVKIMLQASGTNITIKVHDNGIGLPANIDLENPSSMGFTLIDVLTTQLNAGVTVSRKQGTSIEVSFSSNDKTGSSGNLFPSMN